MRFSTSLVAAAALLSTAVQAQNGYKGFNYGAQFGNNAAKQRADFEYEFNAAKQLPNTNGAFTSARLYTMVQHGTANTVIEAIQAAINTKTKLLLGLWASAGADTFNNEIVALKAAIQQYGSAFSDLVLGISVGSEDLYRITPTGIDNNSGPGASPTDLVNYIKQVRTAISGTVLAGKPIGHVDTWTAYVNASNNAVISALDFLGVDAYPYFQTTMANSIGNANATFYDAYDATVGAAQGKPVWVTETAWPVSGPQMNQAVASADNARVYWQDVACSLMAKNVNLFYYTLQDAQWSNPSPSFGIKPAGDLNQVSPLFDLSCPASAKPTTRRPSSSIGTPTSKRTSSTTLAITATPRSSPAVTTSTRLPITPTRIPVPTVPNPTQPGFPINVTSSLEAPHLIVPIDQSHPDTAIGNQHIARLSSTYSTLFNFNIPLTYAGKTCTLIFLLAPAAEGWFSAFQVTSPGGIGVSRLERPATESSTAGNVGITTPAGAIDDLKPGQGHVLASSPCEAGKTVGYQLSARGSLDLQFFQSDKPPVGLFMTVSG